MKKFLIAGIAVATFCGAPALAADMPVKAPPPPVVAPSYSWTGFYVGGNAGYSGSHDPVNTVGTPGPCLALVLGCTATPNLSVTGAQAATFSARLSQNGFIGGGQIGYNWQYAPLVVMGLEADIEGLSNSNSSSTLVSTTFNPNFAANPINQVATVSAKLDYLGTVRGRIGYLVGPSFLTYATGGFAYGGVNTSTSITQTVGGGALGSAAGVGSFSGTRGGWTIGGGFEWMYARNWSVKAEYLYVDLGTARDSTQFTNPFFASTVTATSQVHFIDNIVRAGLNYHFN